MKSGEVVVPELFEIIGSYRIPDLFHEVVEKINIVKRRKASGLRTACFEIIAEFFAGNFFLGANGATAPCVKRPVVGLERTLRNVDMPA